VADGGQAPGFSNPQAKCQIPTKKTLTSSQMIGISKYFNKLLQLLLVRGAESLGLHSGFVIYSNLKSANAIIIVSFFKIL
jgi:hypothetical protein